MLTTGSGPFGPLAKTTGPFYVGNNVSFAQLILKFLKIILVKKIGEKSLNMAS